MSYRRCRRYDTRVRLSASPPDRAARPRRARTVAHGAPDARQRSIAVSDAVERGLAFADGRLFTAACRQLICESTPASTLAQARRRRGPAALASAHAHPDARSHPPHGLLRARPPAGLRGGGRLPRRGRPPGRVVPGVEAFEVLREVSPKNAFVHGLSMEFADRAAYRPTTSTPSTSAFVRDRWLAEVADFLEIDYEAR